MTAMSFGSTLASQKITAQDYRKRIKGSVASETINGNLILKVYELILACLQL